MLMCSVCFVARPTLRFEAHAPPHALRIRMGRARKGVPGLGFAGMPAKSGDYAMELGSVHGCCPL